MIFFRYKYLKIIKIIKNEEYFIFNISHSSGNWSKRSIPRNLKEPETTGEGENPPEGGENPPGPPPSGGEGDNPPGPPPSGGGDNSYNYTDYKANVTDENVGSDELTATESDQSVVYITTNNITFTEPNLIKLSGESSNIENSEFYGVNAAVLVQGGEVSITGGTITTKAKGGNAICATNKGKVTISGTKIVSTAVSSGRGLHATYGGQINAVNVDISSTGASCANLATDRGEGVVTCSGCQLSTTGAGSPLIYSTGQITVNNTKGTATGAQTVVVEGKTLLIFLINRNYIVMEQEIEITLTIVELWYINLCLEMLQMVQVS